MENAYQKWKKLDYGLLKYNEKELAKLSKKIYNERFKFYKTHKYLVYSFNADLVEKNEHISSFLKRSINIRMEEKKTNKCVILEIGSFMGLGSKFMCSEIKEMKLIPEVHCVDLMYPYIEKFSNINYAIQGIHLLENTKEERMRGEIFLHSGKSMDVVPKLKITPDLIYVDGEHTTQGVYNDLVLSIKCIDKKGIILIDDIYWEKDNQIVKGVSKFINEYSSNILAMYGTCKFENTYIIREIETFTFRNVLDLSIRHLMLICNPL